MPSAFGYLRRLRCLRSTLAAPNGRPSEQRYAKRIMTVSLLSADDSHHFRRARAREAAAAGRARCGCGWEAGHRIRGAFFSAAVAAPWSSPTAVYCFCGNLGRKTKSVKRRTRARPVATKDVMKDRKTVIQAVAGQILFRGASRFSPLAIRTCCCCTSVSFRRGPARFLKQQPGSKQMCERGGRGTIMSCRACFASNYA